jgi:hypothetical protein
VVGKRRRSPHILLYSSIANTRSRRIDGYPWFFLVAGDFRHNPALKNECTSVKMVFNTWIFSRPSLPGYGGLQSVGLDIRGKHRTCGE